MQKKRQARRSATARAIASLGFALTLQSALAQNIAFDIPAQPLATALKALADQSGLQLAFSPEQVRGKQARRLQGTRDPRRALNELLQGSGLQGRVEGTTLTIQPAPAASDVGDATLPSVTVSAQADRSGTTEGTGSYTTRATSAATGLALSLKDTPQSVSIVTQQRIEDQHLQSLTEVMANTPGISASINDGNRMTYFSRGFSITNFQYDGIPTAGTSNWYAGESELDAALYDRVEVVRGATGLLTGAGNPAASINLVRKHADSKVFTGEVSLGAGSWDNYRGAVDLSTPITADGRIRGRIVAAYQDADSYVKLSNVKKKVFYGVIDADLTPSTRVSIGADYQNNDPKGTPWGGLPLWYSDGSRVEWRRSATPAPSWSYWATQTQTAFATLEHRFDNDWKANVGVTHSKQSLDTKLLYLWDWPDRTTGLGMKAVASMYNGYRAQDSVTAQVGGPVQWLGRKHEVTLGFLGSEQKYRYDYRQGRDLAPIVFLDGGVDPYPEPQWAASRTLEQGKTTQRGLYGAARFSLSDRMNLIAGGRYSTWRDRQPESQREDKKFIPYMGLTFDISKTTTAYASYTSIFDPQDARDREGRYLDPITGKNFELGIKNSLNDGRLNTSLAVFRIEQDNLAQADGKFLIPNGLDQAYYGAKGVESTGLDAEVSGEVLPGWNVFGGFTHYTAKKASGEAVNTHLPRTLLRLFTTYRLSGSWKDVTLGGGVNWQSRNYSIADGPNGQERVGQGAYGLVNLMVRYQVNPRTSVQVNLNNVFDKAYYSQIGYFSDAAWGAPRSVMATLSYKF
ncbi:ferric-rhodotorulic acid/ferric-coprogen receptor FhuE [Variovorax ginsengisoli]|uniref:Outer membrane receptor for ferric coprogen and ferric-rhodotorulic acid n=1 Tax=Variovorax ginsengisoli TaxID=363844 RepID=A0ABT9S7X2_9BURK|nr:ferric-rhodotorulic acid/ferric-coprogen receptor FhuE [Variovorax ginsengisoli]MDP9899467.1 outer membrane receptor for ferric coprogen and ferric-rhodotorulic acid [Variovorax ginsengisoli]